MHEYSIKRLQQSVEYRGRPIVAVRMPNSVEVQAFYRSSQEGNHWLPFGSIKANGTFNKDRFKAGPEHKSDVTYQYGTVANKLMGQELDAMSRNGDMPQPKQVNRSGANVFIGTKESLLANQLAESSGDREKPTAGVKASIDARSGGERAGLGSRMAAGIGRMVDQVRGRSL
jgi:hypothetical protein